MSLFLNVTVSMSLAEKTSEERSQEANRGKTEAYLVLLSS